MKSTDKPIITLKGQEPFASGGNRLCFRHPMDSKLCLKVIRPDRTPAIRRSNKQFPANLRPLSAFDENLVEVTVLDYLDSQYPIEITRHLPRSFGLVETDLGIAHETDLICDADGLISQTLEQYIWEKGLNSIVEKAIQVFKEDWAIRPPTTRDLIPHNYVVQLGDDDAHLVLIDGFGRKPIVKLPFANRLARLRLMRRFEDFDHRIQLITQRKSTGNGPMDRINNLKR